jgi:HPt (histidine-containing phosphotransfer) domain-containing protein
MKGEFHRGWLWLAAGDGTGTCAILGAFWAMAGRTKDKRKAGQTAATAASFDQPHLARYTMGNPDLEREIIGLFLQQLPSIVAMLDEAETAAQWKMAAHTLKGSAAAVGATAIHACAVDLEGHAPIPNVDVKIKLLTELRLRVDHFNTVIGGIYAL